MTWAGTSCCKGSVLAIAYNSLHSGCIGNFNDFKYLGTKRDVPMPDSQPGVSYIRDAEFYAVI